MTHGPVWIDLANSPHVLFFQPVLAELRRRGMDVVVTARDFAQTVPLCERFGIEVEVVGRHGGAGAMGKGRQLIDRAMELRSIGRRVKPAVAVSHNSYSHALASRFLGVPLVTAMDYEFQPANHLAFRCASLVAVPDTFPQDVLRLQGAGPGRVWRYGGLKEHIALAGFEPDLRYLESVGLAGERPLVVVRPPASMALYHRFENPLFEGVLSRLVGDDGLRVIVLARTPEQGDALARDGFGDVVWHGEVLDGRQLVAGAAAVVSAGGSMNREAAVLGTPAFSVYAGRVAAVDRALAAQGLLTFIRSEEDMKALRVEPRRPGSWPKVGDELVRAFVDRVLAVAR